MGGWSGGTGYALPWDVLCQSLPYFAGDQDIWGDAVEGAWTRTGKHEEPIGGTQRQGENLAAKHGRLQHLLHT